MALKLLVGGLLGCVVVWAVFCWRPQTPKTVSDVAVKYPVVPVDAPSVTPLPTAAATPSPTPSVLTNGPLQRNPHNPLYFMNGQGETVYLTGSYHWDLLVNNEARPGTFDYTAYLDFLEEHGHNFIRLRTQWAWVEFVEPSPYLRTGPALALNGAPQFDLNTFDEAYFDRLRSRVIEAGERGFYVAVVFFQGWSILDRGYGNPWLNHPYNPANNVNGVNGDVNGNGEGEEVHTLSSPEILALQEAYVRKVIDTVHDLDNVMYEISNESPADSTAWQVHMVEFVRAYEATLPEQHLIGMSSGGGRNTISNEDIFASPADWVAPSQRGGYRNNPPAADGSKVIIADTDHIFGIGGDGRWVWQSFLRGLQPIYMDDLGTEAWKEEARVAMGQTRLFAERVNLVRMRPQNQLASSRYCLGYAAAHEAELLVYLFDGAPVTVDLRSVETGLAVEWFDPTTGTTVQAAPVAGGKRQTFVPPFAGDAVLYLKAIPLDQ